VQVNRVIGHSEIADPYSDSIVLTCDQRRDTGKRAAVPGPQIEIDHRIDAWRVAAGFDVVGVHQEHEVAVDGVQGWVLWMHDDGTHHAHRHLHHVVGMRVIHERARVIHVELVHPGLARLNRGLREAGNTIHAMRQTYAVPVDCRVLGQPVGYEYSEPIALDAFDRRTGRLTVIAPQVRGHTQGDLALHGFGDEVKLLDAILHAPGKRPAVERDDRLKGAARRRCRRRLRGGGFRERNLGNLCESRAGNRAGAHERAGRAGEETAA